jgi:phospholipid-binding lipoprotein MlaA
MKPASLKAPRAAVATLLALSLLALQGCATTSAHLSARDPWEPFNREVSRFNDDADRIVLKPVATFYREKVPPLVRTGVANFFGNLGDAWSAVNSLLQFRLQEAEESLARFHLNTMFGVFGIFDVASDLNIERHREDFGQTLGRWGVPAGPYMVLPLLGPSTLRDTLALPIDRRYDLVHYFSPTGLRETAYVVRIVDRRSNLLRVGTVLEEAALDRYSFTRDAYLQRRRAEIFEGVEDKGVPPPLPDESNAQPDTPAAPAGQPQPVPAR